MILSVVLPVVSSGIPMVHQWFPVVLPVVSSGISVVTSGINSGFR